ncbi:MAG: 3-hydroxyacyl-CoA dehydrogenase NAD-binding domain-containing protein [bacterium]|nr:3-hydroxyacyl-CoA dehydrogenase NAD-binding domain-containing protein [bacterium]
MLTGIIGAGTMGVGIATVAAQSGDTVFVYDTVDTQLKKAIQQLRNNFTKAYEKGKIESIEQALLRCNFVTQLSQLDGCDLIIEAVPEVLEIKIETFEKIEKLIPESTILATNTSSLSINQLANALKNPKRFFGLHFFNPVPLMKLVEVIPSLKSDLSFLPSMIERMKQWNKVPVHTKDSPGFIVNRLARPYYGEALHILSEKIADIPTIDRIMKSAGFKMGPFELMDLIGLDVNFAATQSIYKGFFYDPRFRPHPIQENMVNAGLLGRKTKKGFYNYEEEK